MSNPEVRINVSPEIELHEKKNELVASPPHEQADNTAAAGNGSTEEKDKNRKSPPPQDLANEEIIRKEINTAAFRNQWSEDDLDVLKTNATTSLTDNRDNALHNAAAAGSYKLVDSLLRDMNEGDLKTKNRDGNTAFYLAAENGRSKCVKRMLQAQKDTKLPSIRGDDNMLPIQIAAQLGHIKTVKCLYYDYYGHNKDELSEEDCKKLLPSLICRAELLDVAWDLVKKQPNLATVNLSKRGKRKETFLHFVARTNLTSPELSNQNQENFFKRSFDKFDNRNECPHEKLPQQVLDLLRDILKEGECQKNLMQKVIVEAVDHENVEFLSLIICEYPELITRHRETAELIFSNAISKHQKDIFNLLKRLPPSIEKQILDYKDRNGNNILHLAAKLGPPEQLAAISGVALQLQQELMWFEKVRDMVDASKANEKNRDGKTPKALFDEEHKQLKERSEQWMKDSANSCMIVATLIATVAFTAALTVPGGTKEDSGMPRFANKLSFKIFVFADAISLISSVGSLVIFLDIHTSPYSEEDYFLKLPKRLVDGKLPLQISIVAMMLVFCTTIFIVFEAENIWVRSLLSVLAALPVIHYLMKMMGLLFDVTSSTSKIKSLFRLEGKERKGNSECQDLKCEE